MKEFPKKLAPVNKGEFHNYMYDRTLCYLRRDVYEFVIRGNEDDFFDLEVFFTNHCLKNQIDITTCMVTQIINELKLNGWKCKLSYGDTGLFIYSTENPPASCW